MEGVRIYNFDDIGAKNKEHAKQICKEDLQFCLSNLARHLYNIKDDEMKWIDEYFPFTDPSLELEIYFNDDWVEILGSGVILDGVMVNGGRDIEKEVGYAFGLGLERWAMKLFEIGDIRMFWTEDKRFLDQFKKGEISKFKPYSKYPTCYKDIAFWIPETGFSENDFMQVVRAVANDLAETVELIDEFKHPKNGKTSMCFRINYRHMDRNLTNEEVDTIQFKLRDEVVRQLNCELR